VTVRRSLALCIALAGPVVGSGLLVGRPTPAVTAWALGSSTVLALAAVRRLAADTASSARRGRVGIASGGLEQLRQVSQQLEAAQTSAFGVERKLRPLFRRIAAARLARRGVDLDRQADEAQLILGTELWEVVRSDGESRLGGGISAERLRALIEQLEAV
jgi:hypothetical protein